MKCCAEEKFDTFLDQEIEQLSFYMGYLIGRDHAKQSYGFPIKLDNLIRGVKAGISGEPIPAKEELVPLIKRMQKTIVERQASLNLKEAENYLKKISSTQSKLVEVKAHKLFYFSKTPGNGLEISNTPLLHFKISELIKGELKLIYSTFEDKGVPLRVELDAVVPGFQLGVQGMKIGEERVLYVHPDLAYGLGKLDIAPNRLIVFEVVACPDSNKQNNTRAE